MIYLIYVYKLSVEGPVRSAGKFSQQAWAYIHKAPKELKKKKCHCFQVSQNKKKCQIIKDISHKKDSFPIIFVFCSSMVFL